MRVTNREVAAVQRCYPKIYLACHTQHPRRRTNHAQLTAHESSLLAHLSEDEPMRASALARHLGVGRSTLSAAVKRLTALGYIHENARQDEAVMRTLIWSLAGLGGVVVLVACIGWMLPVAHEASRSAHFSRPPDQVYQVVADVASYASWFEGVSRVEMLDAPDGRIRFREHMSTGPVVMEVDRAEPNSRFVTRIADPDQPFGGTWTFDIAPENGGSRLTITERGEIYNPIFRFMARFVFGYTATMEGYLRSLARKLGPP